MTGFQRISLVLVSGEVYTLIKKAVGQINPADEKSALENAADKAAKLEQLLREYADSEKTGGEQR